MRKKKSTKRMSNGKQKWTNEEEEAFLAGVEKHGQGKWINILRDPQFASSLENRSNIDLKDKWRNICVNGHVSSNRENVRTPLLGVSTSTNPHLSSHQPSSVVPLIDNGGMVVPSISTVDRGTAPNYEAMIFEAMMFNEDPNGADTDAILSFIEKRYELPEGFKRSVTSKLRRLVLTGKLEKVDNHYKIYKRPTFGAETSQKEAAGPNSDSPVATETIEDATLYAAYAVLQAENMEQKAIEAMEEADRVAKLVEESMAMLKLAEDLHEICLKDGVVLLAP